MGVWKFYAYIFSNIFTNWMIRAIWKVKMFTPGPLLSFNLEVLTDLDFSTRATGRRKSTRREKINKKYL